MSLSRRSRQTIRHSSIFVCVWSAHSPGDSQQSAAIAYATAIGKPVRVLVAEGARLPEDAFLGIADLEIVHATTPADGVAQVLAWLEAVASP
jgi:hypothetical protein